MSHLLPPIPMRKTPLLTAGSWLLALFVLLLAGLSPDAGFLPGTRPILWIGGGLVLFWLVGVGFATFPRTAPLLSVRAQIGALAPLLTTTVGVILAARGVLPSPLALTLFSVVTGGALWWWCRREAGAPGTLRGEFGVSVLMLVAGLLLGPLCLFALIGEVIWGISTPNFSRMISRAEAVEVLAPFRVPASPSIDLATSGLAFVALTDTSGKTSTSGTPFEWWSGDSVVALATQGLSREQRSWLETIRVDPSAAHLRTIAYAPAFDPVAHVATPIRPETNAFSLPFPPILPVRQAARRHLYRAALAHAEGRPAVADSLIREVISFGLRLRDDADLLIVTAIGASIAREGGLSQAALWRARGRTAAADSLVAALAHDPPAAPAGAATEVGAAARASLIAMARDSFALRSMRWEALGVLGIARCTSVREALFGPSDELRALYAESRLALVRSPKEGEVFDVFERGVVPTGGAGEGQTAAVFQPMRWILGNGTLTGCLSATTMIS